MTQPDKKPSEIFEGENSSLKKAYDETVSQPDNVLREQEAEQIHIWYLESSAQLHPESYNPNAQKSYADLTEEQKFMDRYIASKFRAKLHAKEEEMEAKTRLSIHKDLSDMFMRSENPLEMDMLEKVQKLVLNGLSTNNTQ